MTSNTASNKPNTTVSSTTSSSKSTNPKKNPTKKSQSSTSPAKTKKTPPKLATTPSLECSKEDFEALLGDASGLSNYEEAATELLDCARYGMYDCRYLYCVHILCSIFIYMFTLHC